MDKKVIVGLGAVQETLLLPLWGRAEETKRNNPLLIDNTAVNIIDKIDYDFSTIVNNMNELSRLAWISRSIFFDNCIKKYIQENPDGTIISIGCGLDTTFERIDNGKIKWYDIDLPDVIKLRKKFISENSRRKFLPYSVFDNEWIEKIEYQGNIFVYAAGVLYYFEDAQIKKLFSMLIDCFKNIYLAFDASSPLGVRVANKKVIENGGMSKNAMLKWGIKKAKQIYKYDKRIKKVKETPMFKIIRNKIDFKRKIGTIISDLLKVMYLVEIRTGNK